YKVEYFKSIFTDPPNVDDILNGTLEDHAATSSTSKYSPYQDIQFVPENTARIFRAILFLKNNLRNMARLENEDFKLDMSRYGRPFKTLALELAQQQPSLAGITGSALHSLYTDIIHRRRELNDVISTTSEGSWVHTKIDDLTFAVAGATVPGPAVAGSPIDARPFAAGHSFAGSPFLVGSEHSGPSSQVQASLALPSSAGAMIWKIASQPSTSHTFRLSSSSPTFSRNLYSTASSSLNVFENEEKSFEAMKHYLDKLEKKLVEQRKDLEKLRKYFEDQSK
ncbi:hypothetical protein BGZ65_010460, partial [Modicella reniformis]